MPTRMGGYLNGLIFLMFLLSVGYNNNLLLIFTLLLFGLNLSWVIQTHFHLHALKLKSVSIRDGHAGELTDAQVHWEKVPDMPHAWTLAVENDESRVFFKNSGIILPKRGKWNFEHLLVSTELPFGLYKVWVYYKNPVTVYAWPSKLKDTPEIPRQPGMLEGENPSNVTGPHDVKNLAPYSPGEESRKISWKHYARSGELVIKEGEELMRSEVHFRVTDSQDKEFLLSKIATQMVHCSRTDTMFSLETPTKKMATGTSTRHLEDCLKELAIC
jgi:uncharacterized protein (DUF58 family)